MLLAVMSSLLVNASELPEVCRPPATRDVAALNVLAQRSGALSVGLDSVATWCFDSAGGWAGGGDCAKAVAACKLAQDALLPELTTLLVDALMDLDRPFLGARYVPKRSGLAERPSPAADCLKRERSTLSSQAQAQMDLARLASQAQSEYANYRTWLFTQGLRCAETVASSQVDPTSRGMSVDRAKATDGGVLVIPSSALAKGGAATPPGRRETGPVERVVVPREASPAATVGTDSGSAQALGGGFGSVADVLPIEAPIPRPGPPSMQATWQALAEERSRIELDQDWLTGFLVSRELRECRCTPVVPSDVMRRIRNKERLAELEADDEKNVRCERCLEDAFVPWKTRVKKQCLLMARLTDYELGVLERSDDGNGLPPRCFATTRAQRAAADAGVVVAGLVPQSSFIITKSPEPPRQPPEAERPPAPLPPREDGRCYLRLFMSSTCVAEIEPGPVQLRTGDLLPVPVGMARLRVKSPCGGLAEVYWGKEEKPRVSETFGKNQPLELQFPR